MALFNELSNTHTHTHILDYIVPIFYTLIPQQSFKFYYIIKHGVYHYRQYKRTQVYTNRFNNQII